MSFRFMRLIIFFDLPTLTVTDKRNYRYFRKFLILNGFVMQQESVYSKLALNGTAINNLKEKIRKAAPPDGVVEMLCVTEKQFSGIEMITGESHSNIIQSTDRLVII